MKLSNGTYANWSAVVDKLQPTAANVVVFYRADTSITKVAEVWALFTTIPTMVYGDFGNQGPTPAAFIAKYTGAVAITTALGITES